MGKRIKLADPGINDADKKAVLEVLDSGYLVNGPNRQKFEAALKETTGRKYAIVVSSGTTALLAAMRALGVGPGTKVIVPAFTFPAPASAAAFLGAEVTVCDVDPGTFCLSVKTLETKLDESVSLVIAIDQFGVPAPVPELEELASKFNAKVLTDAACSIGSTLYGKPCGSFGTAATFSFHPRKVVTTGEGGAVLTDDSSIAARVRHVVNHGFGTGGFASTGLNLRMSEMAAAIGLSQLGRLDSILERRRSLAGLYKKVHLKFQEAPPSSSINHQTLAAVLPGKFKAVNRDHFVEFLREKGIEASIASYCLGSVPALARHLRIDDSGTPVALALHERSLALPLHTKMSEDDVGEVIEHVTEWLRLNGVE